MRSHVNHSSGTPWLGLGLRARVRARVRVRVRVGVRTLTPTLTVILTLTLNPNLVGALEALLTQLLQRFGVARSEERGLVAVLLPRAALAEGVLARVGHPHARERVWLGTDEPARAATWFRFGFGFGRRVRARVRTRVRVRARAS